MTFTQASYKRYKTIINESDYKYKNGKMKKYLISCPYCGRTHKSDKPLNFLGISVLHENDFIYQRCLSCQNRPMQEHEKETTENIDFDNIYNN